MNLKVKRFLLGASTLLIAGVAYAKGDAIPKPSPVVTSKPVQANDSVLQNDLKTMDKQVADLKKKVQDEALKSKQETSHLKTLQSTATKMKAEAIAVAEQKAIAAAEARAKAAALAQARAAAQAQPTVQTVSRASGGGDDGGGDDGGGDD